MKRRTLITKDRFPVGTRVRLTGDFLRNTGQIAGGEGHSRWTVVACDCKLCTGPQTDGFSCVAVNEPHECQQDPKQYESWYSDIPRDKWPKWRHINAGNLEKCP